MVKLLLIGICVVWVGMFLFPPIMKMVRTYRSKKGSSKDEDSLS